MKYDEYCRGVEGELNKRFTLVWIATALGKTASSDKAKLTVSILIQNHFNSKDQKQSRELVAGMMKKQLNNNQELVDHLTPSFALGCRRMTPGSGYLESLTKDNVQVVKTGAAGLTENGIIDEEGNEYKVDVVIFATGFDTSFAPPYECIGRNGANLNKRFHDFPKGYLSIMVDDFPNLFRKWLLGSCSLSLPA